MRLLTALLVLLSVGHVYAADTKDDSSDVNSSKAKIPNAATREDIDEEITNAKLRAETGAKSLFSLQTAFNYNGGSLTKPLAAERPQLSPGVVENDPTKLTGSISGKYRLTDHDNLNLGVGIGWLTPGNPGQHGQVEDPYLSYGRTFKAAGLQNVLSVNGTKYTAKSSVNRKLNYEGAASWTLLGNIGDTKLQLGNSERLPVNDGGQRDIAASYLFSEYEFNNTFSFRTVYRGLTFYNSNARPDLFLRDDPTQSLGLGISVTRDIYLYPNVQWVWADIRNDKTNWALTAYINL